MIAHVLIVEDSRTQAEALRGHLATAGYEVSIARSGEEALSQLEDGAPFELVLSDILMPGIDGYELCRRIKLDRERGHLPVILLTSLRDPIDIVRGLEAGADNFLTKPYDPARLLSRVESALEARDDAGRFRMGAEVRLLGHRFTVDADRQQILDLLMGSFEDLVYTNTQLREREEELVRAREQAFAANEAKSRFLARLGHELRTPLNLVIGYSELLLDSELAGDDHEAVEQIRNGGRQLLELVNDLVDIGSIESGQVNLALSEVELSSALGEALDLVRALAAQHDVHLPDPSDIDGAVLVDPVRLRQVLVNLLSNAVKYNRPGGEVAIACERLGDGRTRIDVTDTGHGIPPDRIGRLFVPFDRLGAEGSGIERSGIGLTLVRDLVEAMGGTITVAATSESGTTFRVEFATAQVPGSAHVADG